MSPRKRRPPVSAGCFLICAHLSQRGAFVTLHCPPVCLVFSTTRDHRLIHITSLLVGPGLRTPLNLFLPLLSDIVWSLRLKHIFTYSDETLTACGTSKDFATICELYLKLSKKSDSSSQQVTCSNISHICNKTVTTQNSAFPFLIYRDLPLLREGVSFKK